MESGNDVSEKENVDQPVDTADAVKSDEPDNAEPSLSADNTEVYIEDSDDDHKKSNMSQEDAHAAFRREKKKRKDKNAELVKSREEQEQLKQEVADLKAQVGKIAKGSPPTLDECFGDEESFQQKTREYYQPKAADKVEATAPSPSKPNTDAAEFYLFQKEQEITKVLPDYQEAKSNVIESLKSNGFPDTEGAMLFLSDIARQKGVDIAKVFVAMDNNSAILTNIVDAGNSHIAIGDILERAANKVKTRSKQKIDTKPEPNINGSGPVDASVQMVAKLRDKWVNDTSTKNYNAYNKAKQSMKKKVNSNG